MGKKLLINLLTRMLHFNTELYHMFVDTRRIFGKSSFALANDENWPRSLTIAEMLVSYENGYNYITKQPEVQEIIEENGFYHPSVFHTLGNRRIYVGPGYNPAPPPESSNHVPLFQDLQPIPARTSPSILIPVEPTYVLETPEARIHFRPLPVPAPASANAPTPAPNATNANAIPADTGMQFEHNCGLLNHTIEAHNTNSANWAHGILDAEEDLGISTAYLPEDPFDVPVTRLEPAN